jgi:hypothetical protein
MLVRGLGKESLIRENMQMRTVPDAAARKFDVLEIRSSPV